LGPGDASGLEKIPVERLELARGNLTRMVSNG
jgi:hypothetical protein